MQTEISAHMVRAMQGGVLLDKPKDEPKSQLPAAAGRVVIGVRPEGGGRTTRWRAVCSGCGTVGHDEGKMRTTKLAVAHAESVHPNRALISTFKGGKR